MELVSKAKILAAVAGILALLLILATAVSVVSVRPARAGGVTPAAAKPLYEPGQKKTFAVQDFSHNRTVDVGAECVKIGKYCYLFVQERAALPDQTTNTLARVFDEEIYPGYSDVLSGRLSPGLNADHRVTILFLDQEKAFPRTMRSQVVKGFYSQTNELSGFFNPRSAQSKVIYVFLNPRGNDVEGLLGTIEHETNHLKNWSVYKNNVGMAFLGILSLAALFSIYLALSHLYLKFMEIKP